MNGLIFDVQRGSTVDGPGVRTTVFFKGCNLRCAWCHNPESQNRQPEMLYYRDKCTGCGKCTSVCPHKGETCTLCGTCALYCPAEAKQICGRLASEEELLSEIRKDIPYFVTSGGGATFSGGECLLQPEFLSALLKGCRAEGIHTAVDTAGNVPFSVLEAILPDTNLFLYDIKAVTPELHRQYTGADNARILDNYKKLLQSGAEVWVRVPLIPEVNANEEEFSKIAAFLKKYPPERTELLPYHALGGNKYRALTGEEPPRFSVPDKKTVDALRAMLS